MKDTESQQVNWLTVHRFVAAVLNQVNDWPMLGTPAWCSLAHDDPRKWAIIAAHDGVRPVEQGEGDSFVAAFARASDAVACALELQRAPLAPIRLRIGVHTGEVQLRDEGNYAGPTINRGSSPAREPIPRRGPCPRPARPAAGARASSEFSRWNRCHDG